MGKNSEALQAAEEAIKGSEANKYQLWNTEEYPTVWGTEASEANPGEILFEIVNTTTESPGNESMESAAQEPAALSAPTRPSSSTWSL
jgi:hypothetical protein